MKVGDTVLIAIHYSIKETTRLKMNVSKITKTQIVVENYRFRKDGTEVGCDSWCTIRRYLETFSDELWEQEIKRRKKMFVLDSANYGNITDEQIEAIYKILKGVKGD